MYKLIFFLALCCGLSLSVSAYSQAELYKGIDFNTGTETLDMVLKRLSSSVPGLSVNYRSDELKTRSVKAQSFKNKPVYVVLNALLEGTGFDYGIRENHVIIKRSKPQSREAVPVRQLTVSGSVKDTRGVIPGVTVRNLRSNDRVSTNGEGSYQIPASMGDSLLFSMMGYKEVTLTVKGSQEDVLLEPLANDLDEVVVIGYGEMRKSDLSAAVSVVADLQQAKSRPITDVAAMMQGKVPGVTVVNNGGHPNSGPRVTIRGVGSRADESVLYVVDGVPNAPFNPADVLTMTVLKDAASAAIYGAFSGAAGVILITTRQAGQGTPSIQYDAFTGMKNAWRLPQSLTAADEAMVSNLAYTNAGRTPLDGWDASINPYAQVTRTDWMDEVFRTGLTQRHTLTLNAGTDKFATLLQGRYEKNEGTLLNTFNENLSLRFNARYDFTDKIKFRQEVFYNNNGSRGTSTESGYEGTIISAIYMPRSATAYYEDGSFGGTGPKDSDYLGIHGDAVNPVANLLRNKSYNKTNDLQSVSELSYSSIIPGLNIFSRFSYRQSNYLNKNFSPRRLEPGKPNGQNSLSYNTNRSYQWIWENTANYQRTFNEHSIGAMLSTTAQESGFRGFGAAARGFDMEEEWARFFVNASIFDQDRPADGQSEDRNLSYVARLSYSWADRYFLTGSYRQDIAGRLPKDYQGKGFPGLTAAWKLSSEPFLKVEAIDLLKIRASWGRIGNLSTIPGYYGYPKLSSTTDINQIGDGAPKVNGFFLNNQFNPELSWETSEQSDLGLDISLFKNKISITADYFQKKTVDLIKDQDTGWPNTFGFGAPKINQGEISNSGFEFSANWQDRVGEVLFNIGGNLATLKNEVTAIDDNPESTWTHGDTWRGILTPYRSKVGEPYYSYWLISNEGIFQSDEEAQAYRGPNGTPIQPDAKAGDLKFTDRDGNGTINDGDRIYMGNAFPKLTYGFTANVNWKNMDFSVFFQGVGGVKLFNAFKQSTLNGSEQGYNRWDKILDAWSETNRDSDIPRISAEDRNGNFSKPSDWFLESGNYLRLKNATVGYTFNKLPRNMKLRVYLSGENLLTFTKYSGMDPEVGGIGLDGGQYPVSRIYAAGLGFTF